MNAFASLQWSWLAADGWPFLVDISVKATLLIAFAARRALTSWNPNPVAGKSLEDLNCHQVAGILSVEVAINTAFSGCH
jgi:hypothetical protein